MDGIKTVIGEDQPNADAGKRVRRVWTVRDKRRIVHEAERPGAVRQLIAQQNGVHPSVLNRWRRELRVEGSRPRAKKAVRTVRLLPIQVHRSAPLRAAGRAAPTTSAVVEGNLIEVAFPAGQRITVRGTVDGALLRAVLQELSRC